MILDDNQKDQIMSNIKNYYLALDTWNKIKGQKMPLQAKQLYESLVEIGKPTRGIDIVAYAVENKGLITKQDYAVLAAWYFSAKRRPEEITHDVPVIVAPAIENITEEMPADLEIAA